MQYPGIDNVQEWVLSHVLQTQADTLGNQIAIHFIDGETWSYAECLKQGEQTATLLSNLGVVKGDKVVIVVENPADFCRLWFGISLLGAVMVAINTGLKGQVLAHQLNCDPKVIVGDKTTLPLIFEAYPMPGNNIIVLSSDINLPPHCNEHIDAYLHDPERPSNNIDYHNPTIEPSDLACIMYTSGTSGPSKGVMMPEAHCFMFAIGTIENQLLKPKDTFYISLPLFHANGLFMQLYPSLLVGAKAVIRKRFSASNWLRDIRQFGATHTNLLGATAAFVTTQPSRESDQDHQLKVVTAAPLSAESEKILRHRFGIADVLPLYGMTEVNIPLYGKIGESAPGTCGKVYDRWFEVEVRDPHTDLPVRQGEVGEIMVRPKHPFCFMSGYADMPEKTIEAWRNFWFHTGDAGRKREDGYFIFVDRIKDSIRRRGENISSYEVEQSLIDIEGITEIAAYPVPAEGEDMEDEVMIAVMVTRNSTISPEYIYRIARQRLPKFAVPRYIRIVNDLPKTSTGKVQKVKLKDMGVTEDCWDVLSLQ